MYVDEIQRESPLVASYFTNVEDKRVAPIIRGNQHSIAVGAGASKSFDTSVFTKGSENTSFTLEAWVLPYLSDEVSILSGPNGGLYWNDGFTFSVTLTTGIYSVSYKAENKKAFHVAAIYDSSSISLYIDGALQSWIQIDQGDFLIESNYLVAGLGVGRMALDGVAIYDRSVPARNIQNHYKLGRTVPPITTNISELGAIIYNLEDQANSIEAIKTWNSTATWQDGLYAGTTIVDGKLTGDAGAEWRGIIPVPFTDDINRSRINWKATGSFTIQTSLDDGLTWQNASRLQNIPAALAGMSGFAVDVRILFTGPAVVELLELTLYNDNTYLNGLNQRSARLLGDIVTSYGVYDQIEYRENRGARLSGGNIVIDADAQGDRSVQVHAVDIWFKLDNLSNAYLVSSSSGEFLSVRYGRLEFSGAAVYINGVAGTDHEIEPGEWVHALVIFGGTNSTIIIGSNNVASGSNDLEGQVGSFTLFTEEVAITDVQRIYRAYSGGRKIGISDESKLSIIEASDAWDLYNYDWSAL